MSCSLRNKEAIHTEETLRTNLFRSKGDVILVEQTLRAVCLCTYTHTLNIIYIYIYIYTYIYIYIYIYTYI